MKKTLLFVALSLTYYGTSQSLTQANEPSIGTSQSMYLCDSFTVNYDGVTGSGVTWDYTGLAGYQGQLRDVNVIDATTSTYASDFPSSVFAMEVGTNLVTYYNSTGTDRTSQGFVFSEPSMGDIKGIFSGDEETVITYPFAYGSSLTDNFSGSIISILGTSAASGQAYAWIDGEGTLDLPGSVSLTNVIRYKLVDTSSASILGLGQVNFVRNQYEYYDHTISNLPVLMLSTISVENAGTGAPIAEQTLVLSQYAPDYFVGIDEVDALSVGVYPNPTADNITVKGNFTPNAMASVYDQSGRLMLTSAIHNGAVLNLSDLDNGMYVLRINDNGSTSVKNVVKK